MAWPKSWKNVTTSVWLNSDGVAPFGCGQFSTTAAMGSVTWPVADTTWSRDADRREMGELVAPRKEIQVQNHPRWLSVFVSVTLNSRTRRGAQDAVVALVS